MKVMTVTTNTVEDTPAALCDRENVFSIQLASPSPNAASPMMALSMPMEVIPTCTTDRNWVGLASNSSADWAPASPA